MNIQHILEVIAYITFLFILAPWLGKYMTRVFSGTDPFGIEKFYLNAGGIDSRPQDGVRYLKDLLLFNFFGIVFLFVMLIIPMGQVEVMSWDLAFNTAISFVTNTNWQAYSGEVSLSSWHQAMGLGVQNFLSAATGIAVIIAMARAFVSNDGRVGNFWSDLFRSTMYVLLPLSVILGILLIGQGVVQTFTQSIEVGVVSGGQQVLPLGPAASQIAIKQLGTNGGGFFGVNSAHPFENPTVLSNFLEMIAILLIPLALVFTYGDMVKNRKHAYAIITVMLIFFVSGVGISLYGEFEKVGGLDSVAAFWEGKEFRFGEAASSIWAVATTAASNGSVNAMHSSMSHLTGLVTIFNMLTGEVIFGGVGAGLYGMVVFILLTLFLCGLMIGRTPEYLRKKIEAKDMKWIIVALIAPSCTILLGTALAVTNSYGLEARSHVGPHGFSEILYAWASAAGNNGSAFAGYGANNVFHNVLGGFAMLIGRYGVIIPCLMIADSFANKKKIAESKANFDVGSGIFAFLLGSIVFIVGALTFMPALFLGPIAEYLVVNAGGIF